MKIIRTLTKLLKQLSKTLEPKTSTLDLERKYNLKDLNDDDFSTVSPYGKFLSESEYKMVTIQGQLSMAEFENGTLINLTIGDKTVFSEFMKRKQ